MVSPVDAAPRKWEISGGRALPLRDWNGEFAVFNPLSGHTHILDFIAGSLLQVLADGPRTELELAQLLAAVLELPADAPLQEPLCRLLNQLDEQGLVATVSPC